jgi:hypothetical protein
MAAPDLKLRTLTGTGANSSTRECEWKQGESAKGEEKPSLEKEDARTLWRLPLVGDPQWWAARRRIIVDTERPSHGSRDREYLRSRILVVPGRIFLATWVLSNVYGPQRELLTPPNFRESSRAATVKEWLPVSQSLFASGHAGLGSGSPQFNDASQCWILWICSFT